MLRKHAKQQRGGLRVLAELRLRRAKLAQAEMEIRQLVLDQWLELDTIKIRLQELKVLAKYRELYLDRSRALYELEVKADLGDAMIQTSTVRLQQAEAQFRWMLANARLHALTGSLVPDDEKAMLPMREAIP